MVSAEPLPSWTLDDWLKALGMNIPQFAKQAKIDGVNVGRFLHEARRGKQTIQTRKIALAFIQELNKIAQQQNNPVMSCENLYRHAEIFLSARFCRSDFGPLRPIEFKAICPDYQPSPLSAAYDAIIERVQPRPPAKLFGRDADLTSIFALLKTYPVSVISGMGGNGKTALAWTAVKTVQNAEPAHFRQFDWVTDKRTVFEWGDAVPGLKKMDTENLSFVSLLRSMIRRFQWDDLLGVIDDELFTECSRRLQHQPYLVVVDNLETVENHEKLVGQLLNLLGAGDSQTPSRALITSRHSLEMPGCSNHRLQGIEESQRIPYIQYLQATYTFPALDTAQTAQLAQATAGNPLFIQFVLQRYALTPHKFAQIVQDLQDGNLSQAMFQYIFEPLIENLKQNHPTAYWLAVCAAQLPVIYHHDLMDYWRDAFPEDYDYDGYYQALGILRRRIIIEIVSQSDELSMHPLIKACLRRYG